MLKGTITFTGKTLSDIEEALTQAMQMIGEGYTSLGHPFENETGSFDFTVEGDEENEEDEDLDEITALVVSGNVEGVEGAIADAMDS
jgi:hypothetical protein